MNYLKIIGVVVVLGGILYLGVHYPIYTPPPPGASPAGSTFSSAKIAAVSMVPSAPGTNATTSSILNGDANDRIIIDGGVSCEGIGTTSNSPAAGGGALANWTLKAATTSTSAPADVGSLVNFNVNMNIATSAPANYVSTTTNPVLGNSGRIWLAGSYETFWWNATSTATCQPYVHYLGT